MAAVRAAVVPVERRRKRVRSGNVGITEKHDRIERTRVGCDGEVRIVFSKQAGQGGVHQCVTDRAGFGSDADLGEAFDLVRREGGRKKINGSESHQLNAWHYGCD